MMKGDLRWRVGDGAEKEDTVPEHPGLMVILPSSLRALLLLL